MEIGLDFFSFRVEQKQAGSFGSYPYTGRGLLQNRLDSFSIQYRSYLFQALLGDGVAIKPVLHRTDIDYIAMSVKGGSYNLMHGRTKRILHKFGFFYVEHNQTFLCTYKQLFR